VYTLRLQAYMAKVAREAGRYTNWANPNDDYEQALANFIGGLLDPRRSKAFLTDFQAFVETFADGGLVNGLAQQVLKLTAPGVPDIYQGTELWDDSLVDPDNRRPVDFAARQRMLDDAADGAMANLFGRRRDGAVKLAVTARLLGLRKAQPALFAEGEYIALQSEGPAAAHVVAYLRRREGAALLVAVPRLVTKLAQAHGTGVDDPSIWAGTTISMPSGLEAAPWRNALGVGTVEPGDDGQFDVASLFQDAPLAVLTATT
jgi:(1->4)-alpha-D-glucan 1-alpha-D-glucosylmutase